MIAVMNCDELTTTNIHVNTLLLLGSVRLNLFHDTVLEISIWMDAW